MSNRSTQHMRHCSWHSDFGCQNDHLVADDGLTRTQACPAKQELGCRNIQSSCCRWLTWIQARPAIERHIVTAPADPNEPCASVLFHIRSKPP